jgi:hypothetical protein
MKVQLTATIEILGLITLTVSVLTRNPHTSSHIMENVSDQTIKQKKGNSIAATK